MVRFSGKRFCKRPPSRQDERSPEVWSMGVAKQEVKEERASSKELEAAFMASTVNLRSRRNAAQLHALAGVEREIRAQDSHSRRKYLREFSQAFRNYDSLLNSEQ